MRISELYIYPIKSLRPCQVQHARLRPEGVQHDRRFMLLKVVPSNDGGQTTYKPVQVVRMTEAALFEQRLLCHDDNGRDNGKDDKTPERPSGGHKDSVFPRKASEYTTIEVSYHIPETPIAPAHDLQRQKLHVPLRPDVEFLETCETVQVTLMGSPSPAYRMGGHYDAWFTACLGYEAHLVYTGDFKRSVLAHLPSAASTTASDISASPSWLSSTISSLLPSSLTGTIPSTTPTPPGIVYNECAPYLVTSRASLRDFAKTLEGGMDMTKFRPNVVLDDDNSDTTSSSLKLEPWEEDYWAELEISSSTAETSEPRRLELTANCGRCASINVDYDTGRPAAGEQGTALKKLMKDRRVDAGVKYTPVFGRYAFLVPKRAGKGSGDDNNNPQPPGEEYADIHIGDVVVVTRRNDQRDVWSWPKYK